MAAGAAPAKASAQPSAARAAFSDDIVLVERHETNLPLLAIGITTLALFYGPSAAISVESGRHADRFLAVPVAGPWMSLFANNPCNAPTIVCANATSRGFMLIADGVFQAAGVVEVIVAAAVPRTRVFTRDDGPTLQVTPTVSTSLAGLAAHGTF